MKQDLVTGWDAREHFVRELVYRGHVFLNGNKNAPEQCLDHLEDFYNWSSCFINAKLRRQVEEQLEKVHILLYARKELDRVVTPQEKPKRKEMAYKLMQHIFREVHRINANSDLYLPRHERADPRKAMLNMGI